ncbi:hypothetical protein Tco_0272739 [Tanacetum coccineum]
MLGKTPNKVYDPFLKVGLGYQIPKCLKKAIAAQPKMYDGESLHKHPAEQTYFSTHSTSNVSSESSKEMSDLPIPKMPKESKLLKKLRKWMQQFYIKDNIEITLLEDTKRRWISDSQNSLREFYKTDKVEKQSQPDKNLENELDRLLEASVAREMHNCVLISTAEWNIEMLMLEKDRILSDSKDIQATMEQRIKILENDFKIAEAQYIKLDLKMQNQKEKMACDISWKSKLSKLNDENVLLKTQVDSVVQERENIKLEYQKLFNSIKAPWVQLNINMKSINKLKNIKKGKDVNTKFDKPVTSGKLIIKKNIAVQAKKVSNPKDKTDRPKLVISHSTPKNEQTKKKNANFIARGMYKIPKQESHKPVSKTNLSDSNSTRVESSNSVRRPESKDTKLKNRVLKNTNDKSSSTLVRKISSSVSIDMLMLSHEKCVARYALFIDSRVKRALFTSLVAAKSRKVIQLVVWIVDNGCSKHMTGNLELLRNFVKKFIGTIRFGNDHFAAITGYGGYGVDLLTGTRDSNLYTISISELAASSPTCLMSKATSTKSWLWH